MSRPLLIEQLREYRARIHSGNLSVEEATQALARDWSNDLTQAEARELLGRPVAEVEAAYVQSFEDRKQKILNRPDARAVIDAHVNDTRTLNATYAERARRTLDEHGGDTALASLTLSAQLRHTYGLRNGDHGEELAHCLAVLLIDHAESEGR